MQFNGAARGFIAVVGEEPVAPAMAFRASAKLAHPLRGLRIRRRSEHEARRASRNLAEAKARRRVVARPRLQQALGHDEVSWQRLPELRLGGDHYAVLEMIYTTTGGRIGAQSNTCEMTAPSREFRPSAGLLAGGAGGHYRECGGTPLRTKKGVGMFEVLHRKAHGGDGKRA